MQLLAGGGRRSLRVWIDDQWANGTSQNFAWWRTRIFPANINMAVHHLSLGGREIPTWARLPL